MAPSKQRRRILSRLDDTLPVELDRRRFLQASAASLLTGSMAGCLGDDDDGDGGGDGGDDGDDLLDVGDVTFRQPWFTNPTWIFGPLAEHEGYFEDEGIVAPDVRDGENSPDTIRRVGTGEEEMGHGDWASTTSGLAEGQNIRVIGNTRNRNILTFIYVQDELDGPDDLENADVALASPFAEVTWPVFPHVMGVDEDDVGSAEFAEEAVVAGLLDSGDVNAVWSSLQQLSAYERELDLEFGVEPLGNHLDVYGYPMFVNGDWIEEEDHHEYAVSVLEAYSQAQRWVCLNPDEAMEILTNDINPDLQADAQEVLEDELQVGITLSIGEEVRENGLGHIEEGRAQEGLDALAEALTDDPDAIPSAEELIVSEVQEDAELATFDDDEYAEVVEFAGRWHEFFDE